jgi:hypothetical protein
MEILEVVFLMYLLTVSEAAALPRTSRIVSSDSESHSGV